MKRIYLFVAVIFAISSAASGQPAKTTRARAEPVRRTKPSANRTEKSDQWKTVRIGKWGVASLTLPAHLAELKESSVPEKDKGVDWVYYYRIWQKPLKNEDDLRFDVNFFVTTWDADFAKVTGLSPEAATPENLLSRDHANDEMARAQGVPPIIEEVHYLELDNVRGSFYRTEHMADRRLIRASWYTFRYHNNKAQKINIVITGARTGQAEIMRILSSIKFH